MAVRARIYIPTTLNDGTPRPEVAEQGAAQATDAFGGCTLYPEAEGYWRNDAGDIVRDKVRVLEIISETVDGAVVRDIAHWVKAELKQDTVLITWDWEVGWDLV